VSSPAQGQQATSTCAHGERENFQPEQSRTYQATSSYLLHPTEKKTIATSIFDTLGTINILFQELKELFLLQMPCKYQFNEVL